MGFKEKRTERIECGGRSYDQAAIQELVLRCEVLTNDNEALMAEGITLKRQVGGLKTSNANYRKQVENLKKSVSRYKKLDAEHDALYEGKIKELDDYKKQRDEELEKVVKGYETTIGEKKRVIDGLQEQVNELIQKKNELEKKVSVNELYINELEVTINELDKPWWKRFF